jgi:GNAT superfamily N-acetyltransferase
MTIVPVTTEEEILQMVTLGYLVHAESDRYKHITLDGEKVYNYIHFLIKQPNAVLLIAKKEDVIVGGYIGFVQEHWMSTDLFLNDVLFYVHPDHRTGRTAYRLMEAVMKHPITSVIKDVVFAPASGELAKAAGRFYEHFGFKQVGTVYSKFIKEEEENE